MNEKMLNFIHRNNISMYMNNTPRLRYPDDDGSNDAEMMKESVKWLVENDPSFTGSVTFINCMRILNKIVDKVSEEIKEEEGCECGINFGRAEELEDRILDKIFPLSTFPQTRKNSS